MGTQVIYVFTHDSIFVGEDGPTHQPVEQVASLRLIPGMTVIRPADGKEVAAAWAYALRHDGPTALVMTRQKLPAIQREVPFTVENCNKGAYIVAQTAGAETVTDEEPDVILIATGSEVQFTLPTKQALEEAGYSVRAISMPSREQFLRQSEDYRQSLIPATAKKVVMEVGVRFGWGDIVGPDALFITQDSFGHSAPYTVLMEELGFTASQIAEQVLDWLQEQ